MDAATERALGPVRPLGPDSLTWANFGDWRGLLLGLWAGSMQNMHPQLGAGVEEHSRFFEERWERLFRSIYPISGVVFDGEQAPETARRIVGYHKSIKGIDKHGRPYSALNPDTFFWAHATFVLSPILLREHFGVPLTRAEKERIYAEGIEWYRLYGLSMRPVPPDWDSFLAYYEDMCANVLEDNKATRDVLDISGLPRPSFLPIPDWAWRTARVPIARQMRWTAIAMYPQPVRDRLGLRWNRADQLAFKAYGRLVRTAWKFVPFRVGAHPRALSAWDRVAGVIPADAPLRETPSRFLPPKDWWATGKHYLGRQEPPRELRQPVGTASPSDSRTLLVTEP